MRTVIVTGSSGIGLATGEALAARGDRVILADRDAERARAEASRLADSGASVEPWDVNVADPEAVESFIADIAEDADLGGLVNAAGVVQLGTIADVSVEEWDRVVDVNLKGTFLTCRAVIPHLEARGGGAIVKVASIAGRTKVSLHRAQLRGVERWRDRADDGPRRTTRREERKGQLRGPWNHPDPMTRAYTDERWTSLLPTIPLGRVGEANEVANVIVSLLSDDWSYVTGQCINVNGGQFML